MLLLLLLLLLNDVIIFAPYCDMYELGGSDVDDELDGVSDCGAFPLSRCFEDWMIDEYDD